MKFVDAFGIIHEMESSMKPKKGEKMKVKLDKGALMPTRAHETDAGLDLYAREAKRIEPRGSATFDTGVHIELPHGFFGKIESKSGLNVNYGIVSCGGVVDEGYSGSIVVKLYNLSNVAYNVLAGDKIAQLVINLYATPKLELVEEICGGDRGSGGFGSTGR